MPGYDRLQPPAGALADADLVIEAVYEDYAVKQSVFEKIDAVAKAGAKSGAAPSGQKILVPGSRGQAAPAAKAPPKPGTILTQHTGLPPRATGAARRRPR